MMTSTRYALIAFIALLGFSTTWGAIMTVPAVQKWTQTEGTVQIGPCAVNHTSKIIKPSPIYLSETLKK
jgi:hypothetical protein